ncbi:MAG TPA: hypothetical protein VNB89_05120 [Gemmatimonadaceae bacterium]|nr:hypothetical protein [Gemmatimonadaceae bacterium]
MTTLVVPNAPVDIPPLWFPVFFVALWCVVCAILAFVSGWRSLARRYRGEPATVIDKVTFGSGQLGNWGAHYNNCLSVTVGPAGVGLKVLLPFRILHPSLLVPWQEIVACERWRTFGMFDRTRLRLVGAGPPIVLYGSAARLVGEACGTNQQSTAPSGV